MLTFKSKLTLALLLLTAAVTSAYGEELASVRFGSHSGFDRMVCELSGPAEYEVVALKGGTIELHLRGVSVSDKFFLPKLPSQIKLLTSVEAFREGESHLILEVRGIEPLFAKTTELRGQSWRLAVDLSKLSEEPVAPVEPVKDTVSTSKPAPKTPSPHDEAVPYVPGDRPIETILADDHADKKPAEENHKHTATPTEETPMLAADSLKALEVLAEFYDVVGDSLTAKDYAKQYLDRTRGILRPESGENNSAATPFWILIAVAVASGIIGGAIGGLVRIPSGKIRFPKLKLKLPKFSRSKKKDPFDSSEELEEDIESLDRAVASEKPKASKQPPKAESKTETRPAPKPVKKEKEAPQEVPLEVMDDVEKSFPEDEEQDTVEETMKESLMDRRVKRVLELSAENKSLSEIAQELDMGQDEVKLILDLHS